MATFGPAKELGPLTEAAAHAVQEGSPPPVVMLADGRITYQENQRAWIGS